MVDGHVQHIGNALALISHFQRFAVIAFAVANLARHHHIGQHIHLNGFVSVARTGLATAALHVKRETTRLITPYHCLGKVYEKVANVVENARVGCGIRTWRAPKRRLVYVHYLVNVVYSLHIIVWHGSFQRAIEVLREYGLQRFVDERRLSRAAYARYDNQFAQGYLHIHVF